MIIWTIKLIKSMKAAIAGRKYPHQLAAAVAFGALLGVVPHGNLLALAILIVVLTLRLNHAMAGLTAIGVSFAATKLDPYSHEVGNYVLSNPEWAESATWAFQLPLMPWTDLNNTVVLGSFLIGVAALIPVFLLTYPFFRMLAPTEVEETEKVEKETKRQTRNVAAHSVVMVDQGIREVSAPHISPTPRYIPAARVAPSHEVETAADATSMDDDNDETIVHNPDLDSLTSAPDSEFVSELKVAEPSVQNTFESDLIARLDAAHTETEDHPRTLEVTSSMEEAKHVSVETRIDVIRMQDYRKESVADPAPAVQVQEPETLDVESPPTDEALNYLLRQLRDSQQQRKAG